MGEYPELTGVDLDRLVQRASDQERTLEEERMKAGAVALGGA